MKTKEFKRLINTNIHDLQELINMYIDGKYYFTSKQLDELIKLRGDRIYPVLKNRYGGIKWVN